MSYGDWCDPFLHASVDLAHGKPEDAIKKYDEARGHLRKDKDFLLLHLTNAHLSIACKKAGRKADAKSFGDIAADYLKKLYELEQTS